MADDVFGIVGSVIVGAYQVETVVAEGGFGVVYRARHTGFRAPVALKCLKIPQQLSAAHQEEFLEQFRGEAELLFRLSASIPTVVRPLHVDAVTMADGTFMPFMALEWLEGETLDAIMERRKEDGLSPLSLKKLVKLLTPVARALERAHNYMGPDGPISIVHRDLKPENIFVANVAGERVVKILDFGIGKAKSVASQVAGRASQTHSALASFTPAYGAPEQWVPKRFGQTGPWTDVWGLALTLVEVMAGRPIIDGDQAAMMGTALDATRRPTPRTEGLVVSDQVEGVFVRALALDPRDRYAEAGAFWDDLLRAAGVVEPRTASVRPAGATFRDERSEGGVVPRVETIEAAMPERSSRISGLQPRAVPDEREAATLDPVALAGNAPELGGGTPAAPAPVHVSPRPQAAPAAAAPPAAAVAIPDLAFDKPAPRSRTASSDSMPAFSGVIDFDDSAGVDLALDLAPGEEPVRRLSSGSLRAVSAPPSASPAHRSGDAWPAAASSVAPPSGRSASGTSWPAVGKAGQSSPSWSAPDPPESRRATTEPAPGAPPPGSSLLPARPESDLPAVQPVIRSEPTMLRRILPGAVLLVASIVLTLVDQAVASSSGNVLTFGPIPAGYVAGFFMVAGVVLLIYRLFPRGS